MTCEITRRMFLETSALAVAGGMTARGIAQDPAKSRGTKPTQLEAGKNTHENILFACSGGLSNAGVVTWQASLEVVKDLGLRKVGIGCLAGLPTESPKILAMIQAAKKVIIVDGCPNACARKMVEAAGLKGAADIVLTRDLPMKKKVFREDVGGELKGVMEYIAESDVNKAKELIVSAISASP